MGIDRKVQDQERDRQGEPLRGIALMALRPLAAETGLPVALETCGRFWLRQNDRGEQRIV